MHQRCLCHTLQGLEVIAQPARVEELINPCRVTALDYLLGKVAGVEEIFVACKIKLTPIVFLLPTLWIKHNLFFSGPNACFLSLK